MLRCPLLQQPTHFRFASLLLTLMKITALFGLLLVTALAAQAQTKPARPATKPGPKPAIPAKTGAKAPIKPAARPAAPVVVRPATPPAPQPTPAVLPAKAAAGAFGVGTTAANLGIGVGNRYGFGTGVGLLGGSSSVSPALSLSVERGVVPLGPGILGVGAFLGYQGASFDFGGGDKWHFTDLILAARGVFHIPATPELDVYGGLNLGLRYTRVGVEGSTFLAPASSADLATGIFVGGRYFFSENIGAFGELGYDQSYLKVGLTAKF